MDVPGQTMSIRIGADIGGTFTDIVLEDGARRHRVKLLTTYDAPERALLDGVALLLDEAGRAPADVDLIVHGTTLATNALIQRRGVTTGLLTTEGFRDVLELGDESRFDQYDLSMEKPQPLVPRALRLGVAERVAADGAVLLPLSREEVGSAVQRFRAAGVRSAAICFLHSYRNPVHERQAAQWFRQDAPEIALSLSCEVSPEMREYPRFSTTAANAYVQPLIDAYLGRLNAALTERGFRAPLFLMLSSGAITTVDIARRFPVRLVESGPAGGAMFAADVARRSGLDQVVAFDMGGTTAKLCLIDSGRPHASQSFEVGRVHRFRKGSGLPLRIPVVEMVEIGAGGGSIAGRDSTGRLEVGPRSAGSEPGPACYGRGGGDPTVTDADLVLGRINAERFAGGRVRLDVAGAELAIGALGEDQDASILALGISEIVDENMANAARVHAMEQGCAVEGRVLIVSGGAAPLHAVRVAEKLGIERVVVPRDAGVGSAIGFLRAPIAFELQHSLPQRLDALDVTALNVLLSAMAEEARAVVGRAAENAVLVEQRETFARFAGQGHELSLPLPARPLDMSDTLMLRAAFRERYASLYGTIVPDLPIELLTWKLRVEAKGPEEEAWEVGATALVDVEPAAWQEVVDPTTGRKIRTALFIRDELPVGARITGPALVVERDTTTVISGGFDGTVDGNGALVLVRRQIRRHT
jgi:N-methylhydantoinase A